MPKPVTRDRILATHAKINAFCSRLTDADMHIVTTAARQGLKVAIGVPIPQVERDKARLEMTVNDVLSPEDGGIVIDRAFRNLKRCHKKRDKVYAIQLAHNISGLERGEASLGDGVIDLWQPSEDPLWLTDDDLNLLRGDRLKLLQFWVDHVTLNNLQVLQNREDNWIPSSIEYVQLMSREYDWVHFWEVKTYLKHDKSQSVRSLDGEPIGYVLKRSSVPQEGFEKHHEIHLVLGDGKYYEDPERSMWFCATNGVIPFG